MKRERPQSRHPAKKITLASYWGERIRAAREEAGRTQTFLAQLVGVEQQTISSIERGVIVPSDNLKLRLARCLGREPGDLFDWPEGVEAA